MSQSTNGNATTTHTGTTIQPKSSKPVILRRAHLTEGYKIGAIAAEMYYNAPLTKFLEPRRAQYPSYYVRGFQQRALVRMLNPNNITFIACEADNPNVILGYAQFCRLGDDEGAKSQKKSRASIALTLANWLFWVWTTFLGLVFTDKSTDPEAVAKFLGMQEVESKIHWGFKERQNRWHAQSVVVCHQYQRRGIGKLLMREVIARAEAEKVPVTLEASAEGKALYLGVGFELLAPFQLQVPEDEAYGIMIYRTKGWKDAEKVE